MKITADTINGAVGQYLLSLGRKPKFALMDKHSFKEFIAKFVAKEKFILDPEPPRGRTNLMVLHCDGDCQVEILPVDVDYEMFEVI